MFASGVLTIALSRKIVNCSPFILLLYMLLQVQTSFHKHREIIMIHFLYNQSVEY
jgi:hypothetical protein